jgi:colicin import membrane protein
MNESEAAGAIACGAMPSPTRFGNSVLVALRISGTGAAVRPSIGETVWRDPAIWLSEATIARCAGLPVILDHPAKSLDTEEFAARSVGAILFPYVADRARYPEQRWTGFVGRCAPLLG